MIRAATVAATCLISEVVGPVLSGLEEKFFASTGTVAAPSMGSFPTA